MLILFTPCFNIMICSHDLSFCVAILCVVVGRWRHDASLTEAKRDLKMEKIRSPNDGWKGYLKTWDKWNSQGGAYRRTYSTPLNPPVARVNVLLNVEFCSTTIKLNPPWKRQVCKSSWIKSSMMCKGWHHRLFQN